MNERVSEPVLVSGIVFVDENGDGVRNRSEPGLPGVAVSDQVDFTTTDADGRFSLEANGYGVVFVVEPDGYVASESFWRTAESGGELLFPMLPAASSKDFTFLHASDTHLSGPTLPRMRRLEALVDSLAPSFVLITGDLVRDALRVPEHVAHGLYEMLARELEAFPVPVYTVPGNHEIFGIERHQSLVSPEHPLYGKRMYRSFLGPDYYAFDRGGVHFIGLSTVDYADLWYHGHVDSLQLAWLERDLAQLTPETPVVTFNHIPLVSAVPVLGGVEEDGVAPTLIRVHGRPHFRHAVNNLDEVLSVLGARLEIALAGHFHRREMIRYETAWGTKRFYQTAAVTGPPTGEGPLGLRSGVTLYRVSNGRIDDGVFVPLDPDPSPGGSEP